VDAFADIHGSQHQINASLEPAGHVPPTKGSVRPTIVLFNDALKLSKILDKLSDTKMYILGCS
jgi:hypothetical protein